MSSPPKEWGGLGMDPAAPPFEPQVFADTEEPLNDVEQSARDARAARLAAFYSDTESDDTCDSEVDSIWQPQVWDPEEQPRQTSLDGWGTGGWGSAGTGALADSGAWGKGIGSPPDEKFDSSLGMDARPSARILGYESDRVEPGLRPPLSAERCWDELDSPERAAAVALLGSTEDSWNADHAAASGERVAQRLEVVRMQIGLNLQPAWWEAMNEGGSDGSPSSRVRRVRIGEEGQTPREVREIEMTPLSVRRQQMWRPNWNHSDSDEDDSSDSIDETAITTGAEPTSSGTHPSDATEGTNLIQEPTRSEAVSVQADSTVATGTCLADRAVTAKPGRLRSYEDGEYQRAQELFAQNQQRRTAKTSQGTDDYNEGEFPMSPPRGWKDLATAGWERKHKHRQKYRAARAAIKQEAAENASAGTKGAAKGRRSPGSSSRRDGRHERRRSPAKQHHAQDQYSGNAGGDEETEVTLEREDNDEKSYRAVGCNSVRDGNGDSAPDEQRGLHAELEREDKDERSYRAVDCNSVRDGNGNSAPDEQRGLHAELCVAQAQIAELKAELNID